MTGRDRPQPTDELAGTLDWESSAITKQGMGDINVTYHTWEPRDYMEPVQHFLGYFYDVTGYAD